MTRRQEERQKERRRRGAKSVVSVARIANKLPWWLALLLGAGLFAGLYWGVPNWAQGQVDQAKDRFYQPLVEAMVAPGTSWVQLLGIVLGAACGILAVKNFLRAKRREGD